MHFEMHLLFDPTNFDNVFPVLDSHFCSPLLGSVTCAGTGLANRHNVAAAITAVPNHFDMIISFLLRVFGTSGRVGPL